VALHDDLITSAARRPDHVAVRELGGSALTYAQLDRLSDQLRDRLAAMGVSVGDRVGICLRKSADAVACIFGILKVGAAYVPVDSGAPATRNAYILHDCGVRVALVEARLYESLQRELASLGAAVTLIRLEQVGGGWGLLAALAELEGDLHARPRATVPADPDALAYILYTSGSTGKPKGVMLTHRNGESFIDFCSQAFGPRASDRFSSHAPFHFDLSILDLFLCVRHGATLVLIGEEVGKEPVGLAELISREHITIWYSAPSILSLLAQYGRLAEHDYADLRIVLFAGEVFPVVHLRALQRQWSRPRYFNLYGPTETNVCTWYEIPGGIPDDRTEPYPIGRVCKHLNGRVVDVSGQDVPTGQEGELVIAGPGVMRGYWNRPELTAGAFLEAAGTRWYRTGDIVVEEPGGDLRYVGRRDRMVKRRGYRVELGEIEACLYQHPLVRAAAVVALPDGSAGVRVQAHLCTDGGRGLSVIDLKQFCSRHLPLYMVPDGFRFHASLPMTSTDKIDYQVLTTLG